MVFETMGSFLSKLILFHGYVNEYNGFPKALTKDEEEKLISRMQAGDKSARETLINHNMRLVAHVAKKFTGATEADELISVGSIGLIKAVDSYKANKGTTFSTYASRCIQNEMLMLLRANKKHKICVSIEEPIGTDKDGCELSIGDAIPQSDELDPAYIVESKVYLEQINDTMKSNLTDREYKVLCLRYGILDGISRPQHEVANLLNISRSYISRIETQALSKLKNILKEGQLTEHLPKEILAK